MFDIGNVFSCKSSLSILLGHFSEIEDPRDVRRISHPLSEILLLVVCGTICGCDDYEDIAGSPCVREVVRCSIYLYFSGGRIRRMTWDIHWTEKQLC